MTQTGKCDTCRQRKVKCDEEKPKCGACRKKDRICSYSYGKASACIVQDPNQLTKHGKSRVAPVVHTFHASEEIIASSVSTLSDLHIMTEREAENGQGVFQTLAPLSKRKVAISRKTGALRRKKLELYLQQLQDEAAMRTIKPSSPETALIARYIDMVGLEPAGNQPLSILGTWIQSIPARVGSNRMMDLAVEFFVNSYAVYNHDTYSQRQLARASKEKALKELQLFLNNTNNRPTYDVVLATKMHYAAEALLGIDTMYHAVHAFGLAELLKAGAIANVDDEHFWNLIDNTYIDDVNEAMLAGRRSAYDNDFYLSTTFPPPLSSEKIVLSPSQRASMAIMHAFIQCPRLNCLVRHAVSHQNDTTALVDAVTLTETLWQLNVPDHVGPLLSQAVTASTRPVRDLEDEMPESFHFESVQSMILCTRYWMLINILGGLIDTLYRYFPAETAISNIPDRYFIHKIETDAAVCLAKSIPWAESLSQTLPLVPLRLHTPLQVSIGAWYRTMRRLRAVQSHTPGLGSDVTDEIMQTMAHAQRMKDWIIEECNRIHRTWDVSIVAEGPLFEALDTMAGEKIPDWLPIRVSFEAEDGEMVMKLDYANKSGSYVDSYSLNEYPSRSILDRQTDVWRESAGLELGNTSHDLPYRIPSSGAGELSSLSNKSMDPREFANFVHESGRNLCSTSGWWPISEESSSCILSDSTQKASAFSNSPRPTKPIPEYKPNHVDRHPCLASSFWPQRPNLTKESLGSTPQSLLSPAWSSPIAIMGHIYDDNDTEYLSPALGSTGITTSDSWGSYDAPESWRGGDFFS
ncbi:hypothetical protein BDU57DRAFT_516637 [Ampelomyces quisqualis]|uniref:Zn(2)-C6 fungal-type domain-containing protein n=1 Tax=Ampelomyces quisqualis TaxID=50730 RepID=A0A6A5QLM8_AMPQU|nr:hypothetical protein BDU57DRAFT_516637 [Ampelomyces quisqualis]